MGRTVVVEDRETLEGVEHSDRMTGAQLDFMNAQAVQGPVIEVQRVAGGWAYRRNLRVLTSKSTRRRPP